MSQYRWYIRSAAGVRGPLPHGQVEQYIELGRLSGQDEVSLDGWHWQRIAELGQFEAALRVRAAALAARAPTSAQDWSQERALARQRWADERTCTTPSAQPHPDARAGEPVSLVALRHDHALTQSRALQSWHRRPAYRYALAGAVVLILAGGALWYAQSRQPQPATTPLVSTPDCSLPPAPAVNWQGCDKRWARLSGHDLKGARLRAARLDAADLSRADLGYADLQGASLRGADLRGVRLIGASLLAADLSGADLSGAVLDYASLQGARIVGVRWSDARLNKTVWVDGRICAAGSVGICR